MTTYFPKPSGQRNSYFDVLLKEATNTSPIGAHSQGLSRLAFALLAGIERGEMDRRERARLLQPSSAPQATSMPPTANPPPTPIAQPGRLPAPGYRTPTQAQPPALDPMAVPYLPPQADTSTNFAARWPSDDLFGPRLPSWFNFGA